MISLIRGDCLIKMKDIPDNSVDMVAADPPYQMTSCTWDSIIPLEPMWEQLKRIIKPNGAVVLTALQPFTSMLVMSNIKWFRHEWIWYKAVGSNFASLKYQPMKEHESVLVFAKDRCNYYPMMQPRRGSGASREKYAHNSDSEVEFVGGLKKNQRNKFYNPDERNPSSVQYFNNREGTRGLHPTQKPVALFEYLIKTYTKENELVLDFCFGSGTTAIACINLNRNFVGIELDAKYFELAKDRINKELQKAKLLSIF